MTERALLQAVTSFDGKNDRRIGYLLLQVPVVFIFSKKSNSKRRALDLVVDKAEAGARAWEMFWKASEVRDNAGS